MVRCSGMAFWTISARIANYFWSPSTFQIIMVRPQNLRWEHFNLWGWLYVTIFSCLTILIGKLLVITTFNVYLLTYKLMEICYFLMISIVLIGILASTSTYIFITAAMIFGTVLIVHAWCVAYLFTDFLEGLDFSIVACESNVKHNCYVVT